MIAFLLIGLFGTGVFFVGLLTVCFALMLETCEHRSLPLPGRALAAYQTTTSG